MIKTDNIEVFNFRGAIRGMRNPLNSWDKSDSKYSVFNFNDCEVDCAVGNNDLVLMNKLYKAGSEHRKFARQIFVSMDITAPLYWIAELDTYKIGTTRNSCSFMHKGISKPFEITDFSIHDERVYEVLSPLTKKNMNLYIHTKQKYIKNTYVRMAESIVCIKMVEYLLNHLNTLIQKEEIVSLI